MRRIHIVVFELTQKTIYIMKCKTLANVRNDQILLNYSGLENYIDSLFWKEEDIIKELESNKQLSL